jgi:hypothetical protein
MQGRSSIRIGSLLVFPRKETERKKDAVMSYDVIHPWKLTYIIFLCIKSTLKLNIDERKYFIQTEKKTSINTHIQTGGQFGNAKKSFNYVVSFYMIVDVHM